MSAQDDELIRRYREASAQDEARPGTQVREAVRAHAEMLARAAPPPVATGRAANEPRWPLRALATVAVVGLAGLLVLQFERGTPEEQETAFSRRRAEMPAPPPPATPKAAPPPAPALARQAPPPAVQRPAPPPAQPAPAATHQADSAAPAPLTAPTPAPTPTPSAAPFPAAAPAAAPAPGAALRQRSAAQQQVPAAEAARAAPAMSAQALPPDVPSAARAGRVLEVERLVRQGMDVNARNPDGHTALMLAAQNGHTATVQKLLTLGANPALRDLQGHSAAELARQQGHTALADLIDASR